MSARTLRVGLIGYGNIARVHHAVLDRRTDAELVAVATRSAVADLPGSVSLHHDHRELAARADIDLVAVCSPSGLHAEQALDCVAAGKHVVVEKPLAIDITAGQRAVREARERGLLLSVISQRRFEPVLQHLKGLIVDGRLGRPVLGEVLVRWFRDQDYYDAARWRGTPDLDGGVLMNQAIHAIDLLRWLMGPVESVHGITTTRTHRITVEDTAAAALRFGSGALGAITATTAARPGLPAELNLFFDSGCVSIHDDHIARWTVDGVPRPSFTDGVTGSGASSAGGITTTGHQRQWEDIVRSVRDGVDPQVTGEDALASAALVQAIYESHATGSAVRPVMA